MHRIYFEKHAKTLIARYRFLVPGERRKLIKPLTLVKKERQELI